LERTIKAAVVQAVLDSKIRTDTTKITHMRIAGLRNLESDEI